MCVKRTTALLVFALFLAGSPLQAGGRHYVHTPLGFTNTALRDKMMSTLRYAGMGASGAIAYEHYGTKGTKLFRLSGSQAGITNTFGSHTDFRNIAFKNYTYYHRDRGRDGRIVWGWSNNNYYHSYTYLSHGNYSTKTQYFTSFGPALLYTLRFSIFGLEMRAELPADLQLAGFYFRDKYISNNPGGYLDPDDLGRMYWLKTLDAFLPYQAWNAGIYPRLTWIFGNGNALSLSYSYEYLRFNKPEPLVQSAGAWYISLVTKL